MYIVKRNGKVNKIERGRRGGKRKKGNIRGEKEEEGERTGEKRKKGEGRGWERRGIGEDGSEEKKRGRR